MTGIAAQDSVRPDFARVTGIARDLRKRGLRLRPGEEWGRFVAWPEMNKRIEAALRHLQDRERRGLAPGV